MFKLSIITVNYNNASGLIETINSLKTQTCKNFEFIIIDGGSSDGSIEAIKHSSEHVTYWESQKDNGIYDAMNKGIQKASGDFIMFLNSGDYLADNNIVELYYENIYNFSQVDIFYGDYLGVGKESSNKLLHRHPKNLNLDFLKGNCINHQSSIIKAKLFQQFGLYPTEYILAGDHWLYLISFIANRRFKHIDHPLVVYNNNGRSTFNRALYAKEMELIWTLIVPADIQKLLRERDLYKIIAEKKIVRLAVWIESKIKKLTMYS